MKCRIPEISWHNREPVLSIDIQKKNEDNSFYRLASAGTDTHVIIWYITVDETGMSDIEFASDLQRHQSAVNVVRFSPCGEFLASGDDDSTVIIWKQKTDKDLPELPTEDIDSNKEQWMSVRVLRGHVEDVYDLCWSPDSTRLISGSVDNSAILWKVHKGKKLAILSDHKSFVQGVAWDPKNKYVCTLGGDRTCRIFNLTTFKVMYRVNKACLPVPDGSDMDGKVVRLFHDDTFKSYFRRLSFSPDGEILIAPSGIIESTDSKKLSNCTFIFARRALNKPVVYLPSSDQFTVAVRCCPVLFKLRGGESLFALPYRIIFAVATQSSVVLYDTQQAEPFGIVSNITYTRLTDLSWSSDARILVVSSTDGYCSIINFSEGELGTVYDKVDTTKTVDLEMCTPKKGVHKKNSSKKNSPKSDNKNSDSISKHTSEISNITSTTNKGRIGETDTQKSDIQKNDDCKKISSFQKESDNENSEIVSSITSAHENDMMDTTEIHDASEESKAAKITPKDTDDKMDTMEIADTIIDDGSENRKNGSSCLASSKKETSHSEVSKLENHTSVDTNHMMDAAKKGNAAAVNAPEGKDIKNSTHCQQDSKDSPLEESEVSKVTQENTDEAMDTTETGSINNTVKKELSSENKTSSSEISKQSIHTSVDTDSIMDTAEKEDSVINAAEGKDRKSKTLCQRDSENKSSEVSKITGENTDDAMDTTETGDINNIRKKEDSYIDDESKNHKINSSRKTSSEKKTFDSDVSKQGNNTSVDTDCMMDAAIKEEDSVVTHATESKDSKNSINGQQDSENKPSEVSKIIRENTADIIDTTETDDIMSTVDKKDSRVDGSEIHGNGSFYQLSSEKKTSDDEVSEQSSHAKVETDYMMDTAEKEDSFIINTLEDKDSKNSSKCQQDPPNKTYKETKVTKLTSEESADVMDTPDRKDIDIHNECLCKESESCSSCQQVFESSEKSKVLDIALDTTEKEIHKHTEEQVHSSNQKRSTLASENCEVSISNVLSTEADVKDSILASDPADSDTLNCVTGSGITSEKDTTSVGTHQDVVCNSSDSSEVLNSTSQMKMNSPVKNSDMEKTESVLNTTVKEDTNYKVEPLSGSTNKIISVEKIDSDSKCLKQSSDVVVNTSDCINSINRSEMSSSISSNIVSEGVSENVTNSKTECMPVDSDKSCTELVNTEPNDG